jgi:hypothetical protein
MKIKLQIPHFDCASCSYKQMWSSILRVNPGAVLVASDR